MKRWRTTAAIASVIIAVCGGVAASRYYKRERAERMHFERAETELIVANLAGARLQLFKAGKAMRDAQAVASSGGDRIWLPAGNYFLKADFPNREVFYPVPLAGYRRGPDAEGSFALTIRTLPDDTPPRPPASFSDWAFIPSGNFLLGDRQNTREPHHVWLPAFFIGKLVSPIRRRIINRTVTAFITCRATSSNGQARSLGLSTANIHTLTKKEIGRT